MIYFWASRILRYFFGSSLIFRETLVKFHENWCLRQNLILSNENWCVRANKIGISVAKMGILSIKIRKLTQMRIWQKINSKIIMSNGDPWCLTVKAGIILPNPSLDLWGLWRININQRVMTQICGHCSHMVWFKHKYLEGNPKFDPVELVNSMGHEIIDE